MPPILNLIYEYDENGVLRKRSRDINSTMFNLDDSEVYLTPDNVSIFWNISQNDYKYGDLFELQDLLEGNHFSS